MNKYMVAKSYQSAERIGKPFEKNGKLYTKIKEKCPRCGGQGIIVARVENGQPIPIPVDQGICYQCGGDRYIYNEVRLYTQQEYERMETANERTRSRKLAEQKRKMKEEYQANFEKSLKENGWSKDKYCYILKGDTFSIKEELKSKRWKYDPVLKWHKAEVDDEYKDRAIKIEFDEICDVSAWGKITYRIDAQKIIEEKIAAVQLKSTSEWIGEVGDKLKDIKVQLTRKYSFETKYGFSTAFTFQDENGNILVWFTTTFQEIEQGDWCKIKYATIKKLDIYKDNKQTIITRCKLIK